MFFPDETALINLLGHSFFVRLRHFCTPTVVEVQNGAQRDSFSLGASKSSQLLTLVARVRTNSALNKARL